MPPPTAPVPTVSVIVPTYERRSYVCRAVHSVFAQRYTDWELIVVDDGSTDGTEEALRSFGPRLRYLWQENRGVSAARNAGLRLARGEIVAFLDSDDRWLPDHLQTVVAMLEREPEAVLACTTPRFRIQGRSGLAQAEVVDALPLLLVENWIGYPSGTAVPRAHLNAIGGFDEGMEVLEDGEIGLRLAARGPFTYLQRRTIVRQLTKGSLRDRGGRNGTYFRASEHFAHSAAAVVGRLERPDRPVLEARAQGTLAYSRALQSLLSDGPSAARDDLREACRVLPELSAEPWFVDRRLKMLVVAPRERRLALYQGASSVWPDPDSDTAEFLRIQAALIALGLGRLRASVRLFPARRAPAVLLRQRRLVALLLRRRVQSVRYRGSDSSVVPPA